METVRLFSKRLRIRVSRPSRLALFRCTDESHMGPLKKVSPIRCSKFLEAFRGDGRVRPGDVPEPCLSQRPFESFLTPMNTESRDGWVHMKVRVHNGRLL